jgi:hypothetical protein
MVHIEITSTGRDSDSRLWTNVRLKIEYESAEGVRSSVVIPLRDMQPLSDPMLQSIAALELQAFGASPRYQGREGIPRRILLPLRKCGYLDRHSHQVRAADHKRGIVPYR